MSSTIKTQESTVSPTRSAKSAIVAVHAGHLAICTVLAALFIYLNYIPLFHTDIWGHLQTGYWILEHQSLPTGDPFTPLAEGMPALHSEWLSQVLFAFVDSIGGPHGLSLAFASVVFATWCIQMRVFYRLSRNATVALAALGLTLFMGYSRHAVIRPEIFGSLCFAILLWLLSCTPPWSRLARRNSLAAGQEGAFSIGGWIAIALLFACWANLHGSFAVGLVVLAIHAIGRGLEIAWRKRSVLAIVQDRWFRTFVLLTQLAVVATLFNPQGIDLLIETAHFGGNPNLRDVTEWYAISTRSLEGIQWALSLGLLLVLFRHSRVSIPPTAVLLLAFFAIAMTPTVRMIAWYAPILAFVLTPHLADLWSRVQSVRIKQLGDRLTQPRAAYALLCLLAIWSAFVLTPLSQPVLGGKGRGDKNIYSRQTPRELTAQLRQNPPQGMVFCPQWWGDWMVWDGPSELSVFMTTNVHLIPHQVWQDYMRIVGGRTGWEATLDRYNCRTLVVDNEVQPALRQRALRSANWQVTYEDNLATVFERRMPTSAEAAPSSPASPMETPTVEHVSVRP